MKKYIIPLVVGILAITLLAAAWFFERKDNNQEAVVDPISIDRQTACEQFLTVALFPDDGSADEFMEKCLRGEPVLPGDPSDSEDGIVIAPPVMEPPISGAKVGEGCAIGGCSQQVCGEAGEVEDVATTCEWKEEYACFATASCERQADGQCGWTETTEYNQCIANIDNSSSPTTVEDPSTPTTVEVESEATY